MEAVEDSHPTRKKQDQTTHITGNIQAQSVSLSPRLLLDVALTLLRSLSNSDNDIQHPDAGVDGEPIRPSHDFAWEGVRVWIREEGLFGESEGDGE